MVYRDSLDGVCRMVQYSGALSFPGSGARQASSSRLWGCRTRGPHWALPPSLFNLPGSSLVIITLKIHLVSREQASFCPISVYRCLRTCRVSTACLLGQPRRGWSGFSHLYSHDWCFFTLGTDIFRVILGYNFLSAGFELFWGQELILLRWTGVIKVGTWSCPGPLIPFGNSSWERHQCKRQAWLF